MTKQHNTAAAHGGIQSPALTTFTHSPLVGVAHIAHTQVQLERLAKLAKLLEQAEERYLAHLRNSTGLYGYYGDIVKARNTLAAAARIRQAFNNIANEIQL